MLHAASVAQAAVTLLLVALVLVIGMPLHTPLLPRALWIAIAWLLLVWRGVLWALAPRAYHTFSAINALGLAVALTAAEVTLLDTAAAGGLTRDERFAHYLQLLVWTYPVEVLLLALALAQSDTLL